MKTLTQKKFKEFTTQLAMLNGLDDVRSVSSKFTVEPSIAQRLEKKIQLSDGFLTRINIVPVDEQSGESLGLGIGSSIAGTTDTSLNERAPTDPTTLDGRGYKCTQTNFDTSLTYSKLDMWAKFSSFQTQIRDLIVRRQALDRLMIAFNGLKREKTSDRTQHPLLQDVNIGWLEKIRQEAPAHVMSKVMGKDGTIVSESVTLGKTASFKNLDALVMAAKSAMIHEQFRTSQDLVVICGNDLIDEKYFPLVNKEQENSEKLAADVIIGQKLLGGLRVVQAPFFPATAILITTLDNLSIYWQDGTRRRCIIDNPKRDRIENFESVNEAYVVEDYQCVALIENIEFLETASGE